MKIFLAIFLTATLTWGISTQFDINWPRFEYPPSPREAPKPTPPLPKILPKIPDDNVANPIEQLEREVVRLVNEIRLERGTDALQWDDRLHNLARMHSQDMAIRGYLFHSPADAEYAENAWYGPGLIWEASDIAKTWLESEYHKTWLLCPNLEHIAVGIYTKNTAMYASWTFWQRETKWYDWWYPDGEPPDWLD